jgi:hypothetical protein
MYLAIEEAIPFNSKWTDFSLCNWPAELISSEKFSENKEDTTELAEAFGKLNEPFLYPLPCTTPARYVTFSDLVLHFHHHFTIDLFLRMWQNYKDF